MARKSQTAAFGNLAVLTLLTAVCTSFIFITEGAWWPADPPASRWSWAAISLIAYILFSLLTFTAKKKRKTNVASRKVNTAKSQTQLSDSQPVALASESP